MDDLTMAHYEKAARALGHVDFGDALDWADLCSQLDVMPVEWNGKQGHER